MKRERVKLRTLGERIKELRETKKGSLKEHGQKIGLTQQEFANEMNVSLDTVKNWEQGWNYPGLDMIIKLAEFFECDYDYLLGSQDTPRKEYAHISDMTGLSYQAASYIATMSSDKIYEAYLSTISRLLEQMYEDDNADDFLTNLTNCIYLYCSGAKIDSSICNAVKQSELLDLYGRLKNFVEDCRRELGYTDP